MTLLGRYVLREFLSMVAGVLAGIIVVYLCIEFLQKADRLIKHHATMPQVIWYFLYSIPNMISLALPMATLIGALLSLGGLSRNSEIIAMRAGGISYARIITPMLIGGIALSAAGFANNEYIMPEYTSRASHIRNVEIEKKQQRVMFQQHKLWLRGPDNSIANVELVAPNRTEMLGLNIYKLNEDYSVKERTIAKRLLWSNNAWRLAESRTYAKKGEAVAVHTSDGEAYNVVDSPDDLGMIVKSADEMSFSELWDYVKRIKSSGYKALGYEVELYTKLSFPFASLLMVMISIPFSVQRVRSGGGAAGFALAILIAFLYWLLMSVGTSLGRSGVIPPIIAAWLANGVFGAAGIAMLLRLQMAR